MFPSNHHNIWDEHQWEAHINEMSRRHEQLRDLIEAQPREHPRWLSHIRDFPTKLDAVDAYIEEELLLEESNFPLNEQMYKKDEDHALFRDEDEDEDEDPDENWSPDEDGDLFDEPEDEEEDDEEEDEDEDEDEEEDDLESFLSDIIDDETLDESSFDYASLENIAIYTDARDLSADLLIFNDSKPHYMKHPGFIHLVSELLMVSTKLAAAYSMGFDVAVLGANIAYCKKGLQRANLTLIHLQSLKDRPLSREDYYELHRRLYELRNNIAMHIQDTRNLFRSQI